MFDLVLLNANVITMDPALPKAKHIGIRNGRIAFVSADGSPLLGQGAALETVVIDCQGKTIVPGFIDPHCHLVSYAQSFVTLDVSLASSIVELQQLIRKAAMNLPPGTWILGGGYNEFNLVEKRHANRWDLDAVSPDHPVKLTHRSGHAHLLNSLALERVGISLETGDPPNGLIDRAIPSGEPTGLLYGMGRTLAQLLKAEKRQLAEDGIHFAGRALSALGITSIHDVSVRNDLKRYDLFRSWQEQGRLAQRVSMVIGWDAFQKMNRCEDMPPHNEFLRIDGVKIVVHEITGELSPKQAELNDMILQIHKAGYRAVIHAVEEKHIIAACQAIEHALSKHPTVAHSHRIEHCSVCSPALARRLSFAGITVVTQPSFVYYNGERYLQTVSAENIDHLYPVSTLIKQGVTVAGSSDFPIVPADPLIGIYAAITRKAKNGELINPEEGITPVEALSLFTDRAAKAICTEAMIGSIAEGKMADLILLSDDPTNVPAEAIKDIQVELTIINGKVVWEKTNNKRGSF